MRTQTHTRARAMKLVCAQWLCATVTLLSFGIKLNMQTRLPRNQKYWYRLRYVSRNQRVDTKYPQQRYISKQKIKKVVVFVAIVQYQNCNIGYN